MKKLISLSIAGIFALSAQAQKVENGTPTIMQPGKRGVVEAPASFIGTHNTLKNAKTTNIAVIASDTFNSTSLTTGGWTAGGNTGSDTWNWITTGNNWLPSLRSTTRAGGWMAYDAHTIALAHPGTQPQIGYLTSPAYNCSTRPYVAVVFQQYAEHLADSFYVIVSTNNFATSTNYLVAPNNALGGNQSTDNPHQAFVNISSAAAMQSNVKIRFQYVGKYTGTGTSGSGGTYGWAIDDFQLLEIDATDVAVHKSGIITPLHNANGYTSFGSIPVNFVDSLTAKSNLANVGGVVQFNVSVANAIYKNGAQVSNKSVVFSTLPVNAYDSTVDFSNTGISAPGVGSYTAVITATQTGETDLLNNRDSVFGAVTDSVWSMIPATSSTGTFSTAGGYYLQNGSVSPSVAFYSGSLFEVGQGKRDTLTSVDIAFYPLGGVGCKVRAEFYKQDASDPNNPVWNPKGFTETKTLTAANIPASFTAPIIWTKFMQSPGTGVNKNWAIFDEGEWAVVITAINPPQGLTAVVYSANGPKNVAGLFGLSDTSNTSGSTFGTRVSANEVVPLMRLNFSNNAKGILTGGVGVNNVANAAYELNAYPNPAHNEVTVSFKSPVANDATVQLVNTLGQVVSTQTVNHVAAGQTATVRFSTSQLAAGVYYYNVNVNGARATNRLVVSH